MQRLLTPCALVLSILRCHCDVAQSETKCYRGYKIMQLMPNFLARRPHIAEHDLAGVVIDSNSTAFQKGDEVFGWNPVRTCHSCPSLTFYDPTIVKRRPSRQGKAHLRNIYDYPPTSSRTSLPMLILLKLQVYPWQG